MRYNLVACLLAGKCSIVSHFAWSPNSLRSLLECRWPRVSVISHSNWVQDTGKGFSLFQANKDQLVPYLDQSGRLIKLGLRFKMEKRHFQMQELRLKCVASYHFSIANFSKSITIRTFNRNDALVRHIQSDHDYENKVNQSKCRTRLRCPLILSLSSWLQTSFQHHYFY